jgi:uncharacterized protein (TIGR03086 family)
MEYLDALPVARVEFERRLTVTKPDQWDEPTPCSEWTVGDLVTHIVVGCRMTVALLEGASADEAFTAARAAPPVKAQSDFLGEFTSVADAQEAAFRKDGVLSHTVHHRIGDIPATQLLEFRTADYALHAWDLARAIGADEELAPDLVALLWQGMVPMAPMIGQTGQFGGGPTGAIGDDAPLQARLLDLAGRRP